MTIVKAIIQKEHYSTQLLSLTNKITADERISDSGGDKGFSPTELLAGSLAACTSITLKMYAERKKWQFEKAEVNVFVEKDALENITNIHREINLFGVLAPEQKIRLLDIANHCPIHKILSNPININTILL